MTDHQPPWGPQDQPPQLGQPQSLQGPSRLAPRWLNGWRELTGQQTTPGWAWGSSPSGAAGDHVLGLSQVHPQCAERRLRRTNVVSREDS